MNELPLSSLIALLILCIGYFILMGFMIKCLVKVLIAVIKYW